MRWPTHSNARSMTCTATHMTRIWPRSVALCCIDHAAQQLLRGLHAIAPGVVQGNHLSAFPETGREEEGASFRDGHQVEQAARPITARKPVAQLPRDICDSIVRVAALVPAALTLR